MINDVNKNLPLETTTQAKHSQQISELSQRMERLANALQSSNLIILTSKKITDKDVILYHSGGILSSFVHFIIALFKPNQQVTWAMLQSTRKTQLQSIAGKINNEIAEMIRDNLISEKELSELRNKIMIVDNKKAKSLGVLRIYLSVSETFFESTTSIK